MPEAAGGDRRSAPSFVEPVRRLRAALESFWAPDPTASSALPLVVPTAVLAFLLLVSRRSDALFRPQFWAEDGLVFFREQLVFGFGDAVVRPYAGYLLLVPRLVAGAVDALAPTVAAPAWYALASLLAAALSCAWVAAPQYRRLVPSDALRIAGAVLLASRPHAEELIGNLTNLHWDLAWLGYLLVLAPAPRTPAGRAGAALAWVAIGLTSPSAIALLPVWVARLAVDRAPGARLLAGVALAVSAAMAWSVDLSANPGTTARPGLVEALGGAVTFFVWRVSVELLPFPQSPVALATGGILFALLAGVVAVRGDARLRVWLAISLAVLFALLFMTVVGRPDMRLHLTDGLGGRYFVLPLGILTLLVLVAASLARGAERAVAALVVASLAVGYARGFRVAPLRDEAWPAHAARLERARRQALTCTVRVPINPPGWRVELPLVDGRPTAEQRPADAECPP